MPTRYQQLREAVDRLSWTAAEQHAHLERIHAPVSNTGNAVAFGNDELALEFDDIFTAAADMMLKGEITDVEVAALKPLNNLLEGWSRLANPDFWRREGLWAHKGWEEVRTCAKQALAALPSVIERS